MRGGTDRQPVPGRRLPSSPDGCVGRPTRRGRRCRRSRPSCSTARPAIDLVWLGRRRIAGSSRGEPCSPVVGSACTTAASRSTTRGTNCADDRDRSGRRRIDGAGWPRFLSGAVPAADSDQHRWLVRHGDHRDPDRGLRRGQRRRRTAPGDHGGRRVRRPARHLPAGCASSRSSRRSPGCSAS